MRQRFLKYGLEGFQNYEALELLLSYAIPRKDVKPLAKSLLERCGTLSGVLNASAAQIGDIPGVGESTLVLLRLCREIVTCSIEEKMGTEAFLNSGEEAANFLRMKIGTGKKETLMAIFLNSRRRIIAYKMYQGTVDHAAVYTREVLEEALLCHACSVVLAHNHPSGTGTPSKEDILLTEELACSLRRLGISLLDHLIVTQRDHTSIMNHPEMASAPQLNTACDVREQGELPAIAKK